MFLLFLNAYLNQPKKSTSKSKMAVLLYVSSVVQSGHEPLVTFCHLHSSWAAQQVF